MKRSFLQSESGNFGIYFALTIIPVMGAAGLAIDYTGQLRAQSEMQQAADVAVLAASSATNVPLSERKQIANDYFEANFKGDVVALSGELREDNGGYVYVADGTYETSVAGILGFNSLPIQVVASTAVANDPVEIALVLDNTGSMAPYINGLKSSTTSFAQTIFEAARNGNVKMAVVPFNGAVNPGLPHRYIDQNGDAAFNGVWFENVKTVSEDGCVQGGGEGGPGNSRQEGAWLSIPDAIAVPVLAAIDELFGVKLAHAWTKGVPIRDRNDLPPGYTMDGCWAKTPSHVSHSHIYDWMQVNWEGCVEARAEPYDTDDTAPGNNPDTLFVQYLWPSEPSWVPGLHNPYVDERPGWNDDGWDQWLHSDFHDIVKYINGNRKSLVDYGATDTGPNKGCPAPLLRLTSDASAVKAKLQSMTYYVGSGTVASEGVMWGWRVLSPGEPFTEGASGDKARKILVLFGDGKNEMNDNMTGYDAGTDYGAYGYGKGVRFGPDPDTRMANVTPMLNDKMNEACENAKNAGIEIYTVLFNESDPATKQLYVDCASRAENAYDANNTEALKTVFANIAASINKLRLTQ